MPGSSGTYTTLDIIRQGYSHLDLKTSGPPPGAPAARLKEKIQERPLQCSSTPTIRIKDQGTTRPKTQNEKSTNMTTSPSKVDLSPQFSLHPGRPEHAAAIAKLGSEVFSSTFAHDISASEMNAYISETYSVSRISGNLSDRHLHFIVALNDHGILGGFANLRSGGAHEDCITHLPHPIELQRLYIDKAHQSKGLGRTLMTAALDLVQKLGFRSVWLGVGESNIRARRFYEQVGFARVGERRFHTGMDVEFELDHVMALSFDR